MLGWSTDQAAFCWALPSRHYGRQCGQSHWSFNVPCQCVFLTGAFYTVNFYSTSTTPCVNSTVGTVFVDSPHYTRCIVRVNTHSFVFNFDSVWNSNCCFTNGNHFKVIFLRWHASNTLVCSLAFHWRTCENLSGLSFWVLMRLCGFFECICKPKIYVLLPKRNDQQKFCLNLVKIQI